MDIRLLSHDNIDKKAWDTCIQQAVNGNIYGYSWYLDIVCDTWDALVSGDYDTIFPLTHRKKSGIWYLYQPAFTQQLGIYSIAHLTPETTDLFLKAIPDKYKLIQINLNQYNKPDNRLFQIRENLNHELDLIEPYHILKKGYAQNTGRNIAKALRNGISISGNVKPEEIVTLFRNNKGKSITHITDNDYQRLTQLAYECIVNRKGITLGAYTRENELCAGALIVLSHRKAVFLFSATNDEAKAKGAMFMIIDNFIQDMAGHHLTLDFEGSNDPNLARFYKSFGSSTSVYPSLDINRLPLPFKALLWLYKRLKA